MSTMARKRCIYRVGKREDLLDGCHLRLAGRSIPPLDDARILHDHPGLDGGAQDRSEEAVALGNRTGTDSSVEQLRMPTTDASRRQAAQFNRAETWEEVKTKSLSYNSFVRGRRLTRCFNHCLHTLRA